MADLVQWLTAQLDADERIARSAVREHEQQIRLVDCDAGDRWFRRYSDYGGTEVVDVHGHAVVSTAHDKGSAVRTHIAAHDPARVLREIDAKRRIVEQHRPVGYGGVCLSLCHTRAPGQPQTWPCLTLRLLALPYTGREGYRPEWAPTA